MKLELYENLQIEITDEYDEMNKQEVERYYNNLNINYAYINRENNSAICFVLLENPLEKKDVQRKITEYQQYYSRMVPGFRMGELMLRRADKFNTGILTFQSNAPTRTLFNLMAVSNLNDKELVMNMCCEINDAFEMLPKFVKMVNSMKVSTEN